MTRGPQACSGTSTRLRTSTVLLLATLVLSLLEGLGELQTLLRGCPAVWGPHLWAHGRPDAEVENTKGNTQEGDTAQGVGSILCAAPRLPLWGAVPEVKIPRQCPDTGPTFLSQVSQARGGHGRL